VLVLLSATHGVEGFSGSAAQCAFLHSAQADSLPNDTAVLLLHAINPHGFAWLRRVNEDGVDLNRNWIDFTHPLPENSGYDQLLGAIIPASLDAPTIAAADAQLLTYAQQHGQVAYESALSAGQYRHPHGLFYGGVAASWSRRLCEQVCVDYALAGRTQVALIDFHTGLGPFGYGEPICDHPPGSRGAQLAQQWYGQSVTEPALGSSSSVAKHGLSDYGWQELVGEPLVFIALEFGTYPFAQMIDALRGDHWLHAQCAVDWHSPDTQPIKAAMRRFFYPATDDWQEMVLWRSAMVIRQSLAGLASDFK